MKKLLLLPAFLMLLTTFSSAQSWHLLPNSPAASYRHDDLFFINPDTGWVVNVDGYIYKTTDGGNSFTQLLYQPATSFRSVGFINASQGFAGNLGPGAWSPTTDTMPLYRTLDGGTSWQPVTNISGPLPAGICGISVVNDTVIYAVGRVGSPCHIMKTTDGGNSWISTNFGATAFYLIDCKFFSPDTGLVVGCTGTNYNNERYAIFYTTDGGSTWTTVANTTTFHGHCWKVSFPSRMIGYASVESWQGQSNYPVLKTTDGGLTWVEKIWNPTFQYMQGLGFVNDSTGWCGDATYVKKTTDGGNTWTLDPFVENFNRMRRINDTLAYASGTRIWKYSSQTVGLQTTSVLPGLALEQNYPNPFSSKTTIKYTLPHSGKIILKIYDLTGRPVATLVNQEQQKGTYEVPLTLPYHFDAHFEYTLSFDNVVLTKQMLMVR